MFSKKIWIKVLTYVGIMMCAVAVLTAPATSMITYAAESTDVETCADFKEWLYKIEDGLVYKRLYNASTGLWETDWIYVGVYGEGPA